MEWIEGERPVREKVSGRGEGGRGGWGGERTAVDAKDLVVDDDAERQKVKHVGKVVPDAGVAVLAGTFRVEAVRLRHAARLVVPADQMDSVGVSQF